MAVLVAEDWTGVALGSDPGDAPGWQVTTSSAGVRTVVDTPTFAAGVRSARYEADLGSGSIQTPLPSAPVTYASWYWQVADLPTAANRFIAYLGLGGQSAQMRLTGQHRWQLRDAFAAVATSTLVAQPGQWYRFEWTVDTDSASQTLAIFTGDNLHGSAPDDTIGGAYTRPEPAALRLGPIAAGGVSDQLYARIRVADDGHVEPYAPSGPDPVAGEIGQTLPAVVQQAAGTVTGPGYTATAGQTIPAVVQQAAGAVTPPAVAGSVDQALPPAGQQVVATSPPPVYLGGATSTLGPLEQTAAAVATPPATSGQADQHLPSLGQTATSSATPPVYGAAAGQTLPALGQTAAATVAPPVYAATAVSTLGPAVQQASAMTSAPGYTATAVSELAPLEQTSAGTVTAAAEAGGAASVLPALGQTATGTATVPVYVGTATSTLGLLEQAATSVGATTTTTGTVGQTLPTTVVAVAGTVTVPDRPPRGVTDHTVRVGAPAARTTAGAATLRSRLTSAAPTVSTTAGTATVRTTAGPAVLNR